jgi:acetolactate synthase-1/3 small subunit
LEQKGEDVHILQVVGSTRRIDAFLEEVGQEHIIEIARTGVTALEK